ncbi:MAG TPA: NAD(P)-dependent alcohol dehydrogenase [Candidatus Nanopelagicales bacterium]|nr:NAD(P)-dependent alcohol dehydrogenase [Candidatus Nanopelagicales bacterium]
MKQRVSVLDTDLTLRIEEREIPEPGSDEVLVQVKSVGVCGSDIHYFEHGRIADFIVEQPLVLGHEASGVVSAVGSNVTDLEVGTTVAMEPGVPCGRCKECRAGRYNLCPDVQFFATPPIDGAFCEYVLLPRDFVHPVPSHVSFDAAALVEPLSVGVWACQKANVSLGTRVLITGGGPIGAICALVARARGANVVAVTDVNGDRRAQVEKLGFPAIDPMNDDIPEADVLLECSGAAPAIDQGIRALAPAGTAVLIGMAPTDTVAIPVGAIQGKEIWLTGTFRYANTYPDAVELVASGRVDLDAIVSGSYSLEEVEKALTHAKKHPADMKVMVRP